MKEDEETDVIILLLSMIYRYLNSLLLKFSIRYFSYINGCHTVIIPLFITPPPSPYLSLSRFNQKKAHKIWKKYHYVGSTENYCSRLFCDSGNY